MTVNRPDLHRPDTPREGVSAPPRLVVWLVLGLFVLAVVGAVGGVVVFRSVLRPAQQQRVIDMLPFMANLLDRPDPNATLPTVVPPTGGMDPMDLLNAPLVEASTAESTPPVALTPIGIVPSPTALPSATPTPEPTATPTPTATPVPTATPEPVQQAISRLSGASMAAADTLDEMAQNDAQSAAQSASVTRPRSERLFGLTWAQQTWNNCGPATITMALSYYGWGEDQAYAASYLKPDREDKNVSPAELVAFVNEHTGVRAISRMGGDLELIRQFVAAGFPVVIETGSTAFEGYDWIGHYKAVVGYDDNQQLFFVYDSWLGTGDNGAGLGIGYDQLDRDWQAFNRTFIVLYLPAREGEVARILGPLADVRQAAEHALQTAQGEARQNPQNQYAWFNMGTSLAKLERYDEAAAAFDRASQIGLHFRMLWYQFGPFEAYYHMRRYDDVLAYVNANLANGGQYVEETHYWQGRVYQAQGQTERARQSYARALQHNNRFAPAQDALNALGA